MAPLVILAACSRPAVDTADELNSIYENALKSTAAPVAAVYEVGSEAEMIALDRLEKYFASMTPESVRNMTQQVYAGEALLYDNVVAISGQGAIENYFATAAASADEIRVEFLQVARDQEDYFVRWRMSITSERLNDGQKMISYGLSQFRFNSSGQILLHRDFWDVGTGFYEHLPIVNKLIVRLRSMLAHAG